MPPAVLELDLELWCECECESECECDRALSKPKEALTDGVVAPREKQQRGPAVAAAAAADTCTRAGIRQFARRAGAPRTPETTPSAETPTPATSMASQKAASIATEVHSNPTHSSSIPVLFHRVALHVIRYDLVLGRVPRERKVGAQEGLASEVVDGCWVHSPRPGLGVRGGGDEVHAHVVAPLWRGCGDVLRDLLEVLVALCVKVCEGV
jgi:hypothetical protein